MRRSCFVVESGTDVRIVEQWSRRYRLTVLARRIPGGAEISQDAGPSFTLHVGPSSRVAFAAWVFGRLAHADTHFDHIIVQGYGLAACATNIACGIRGVTPKMLVCSPAEEYYQCRQFGNDPTKPFYRGPLWFLQLLGTANARLGGEYVALSEHLGNVVKRHGAHHKIDIIPIYGVDTRCFTLPTETKPDLRSRLHLPMNGSLIFFSSRIAPEKDVATLLQAIAILRSRGRDVWLLNCSGAFRALRDAAEDLGIHDFVIARDAVHPTAELPAYYQAADLCVQASRAEGLGFSPLEALACGTPVVAARVGGLRETVRDGETGWTYEPGNAVGLATAIAEALDNPNESARRTTKGRKMVADVFEASLVFDRFDQLLLER